MKCWCWLPLPPRLLATSNEFSGHFERILLLTAGKIGATAENTERCVHTQSGPLPVIIKWKCNAL